MYDKDTSIQYIESQFPVLSEDLHDEIVKGLLHLQVGEFSRLAQESIDSGNKDSWSKVTDTFITLWKNCAPEVTNALNVYSDN
ncbi:MAG: hypothetical protein HQL32_07940 [Planctomycetes bacterium]|nr:hypothetical protein [Planctomycetota bacterium]